SQSSSSAIGNGSLSRAPWGLLLLWVWQVCDRCGIVEIRLCSQRSHFQRSLYDRNDSALGARLRANDVGALLPAHVVLDDVAAAVPLALLSVDPKFRVEGRTVAGECECRAGALRGDAVASHAVGDVAAHHSGASLCDGASDPVVERSVLRDDDASDTIDEDAAPANAARALDEVAADLHTAAAHALDPAGRTGPPAEAQSAAAVRAAERHAYGDALDGSVLDRDTRMSRVEDPELVDRAKDRMAVQIDGDPVRADSENVGGRAAAEV